MVFTKENFISNLYQTSMPKEEDKVKEPLLSAKEKEVEVYDFDKVKEWFCEEFRNKKQLRSCDAYYYGEQGRDYLLIEFKNAHHLKMKSYMDSIWEKAIDTHMLLLETFWSNKSKKDIAKRVCLLIVYNDKDINYGAPLRKFNNMLNSVKSEKGTKERETKNEVMLEEAEYQKLIEDFRQKYRGSFYKEVEFIEKKDFYELYIDAGYFKTLAR